MRERLQELRERKEATEATMRGLKTEDQNKGKGKVTSSKQDAFFTNGNGVDDTASDSDGSDSGSDEEGDDGAKKSYKRSSKHAPTALPANRAVGRHRDVVDVPKNRSRDPRFDVTSGQLDRNSLDTRYSFINDYQSSELTQLKKALKDPKARLNDEQRDKLQRKMISLESKLSHNKAREREEKVRQEHKKKEREAVAQGKNPFYLKKSDVKKSRQKDKVIQRRRKKLVAKERKNMPLDRRV
jgi:ribosomal RNA-processing protein 36